VKVYLKQKYMFQLLVLNLVKGVRSKSLFHVLYKFKNIYLFLKYYNLKHQRKIIYVLTPPMQLPNIGDHAQVVGIKKWMSDKYPDYQVLEFNKDETIYLQWAIKKLTSKNDLVFIHSGGNMGDSGLWSERGRRLTIKNLPDNKIISLPQTIFFSDTDTGRKELKISQAIYNQHPNLIIMARDFKSESLAREYFPNANIISCPDFVLYLQNQTSDESNQEERVNTLLCLRKDSESILTNEKRTKIKDLVNQPIIYIDTTLPRLIPRKNRENELKLIIQRMYSSKIVITDRFHGLIFAVLTKTPCIVLSTVNHKITSAFKWFDGINFVAFAHNLEEIPRLINEIEKLPSKESKDWATLYFDSLKTILKSYD